ncbi:protein Osi24 isoform X1 [Megachile rotundata]|uniref:protein Osi24 isoform X1 n=1 Tax=Megachile rotundata TaxID=143995 RepID=UPI003FD63D9C
MIDSFVQPKYVRLSKLTFNAGRFSKTTSRPPNDRGSRCSYRSSLKVASRERERESSATETQRTMLSRGLLALMAIAWLQPSFGDHVSNDTGHEQENEVFSYDLEPHPHESPDKPSKLDTNLNQMIQTDDKLQYQIEASQLENATSSPEDCQSCVQQELSDLLDRLSGIEDYNVTDSVQIVRNRDVARTDEKGNVHPDAGLIDKVHRYAREHVIKIRLSQDLVSGRKARTFFNAFGLKKLLLPLIFGVQIIKSVLIALFLPSIIGSIGNIVGKGVTSFAQSAHTTAQPEENFEFKDNSDLYNDDYLTRQPVGTLPASAMYDESMMQPQKSPEIASRYSFVDPRITHANAISDRYYTRHVAAHGLSKKQDFKVFHEIPTSSLLLTNYDPFYSPLLSRLDAVFSRLGHTTEGCREYAVCAMYRSPARFAPYSNLVSAQLSRELNELRRPSSDNPDVLRFFRYMKAAKDGQDGVKCEDAYSKCAIAQEDQTLRQNQAMLATYQDIDKLVHARKL